MQITKGIRGVLPEQNPERPRYSLLYMADELHILFVTKPGKLKGYLSIEQDAWADRISESTRKDESSFGWFCQLSFDIQ